MRSNRLVSPLCSVLPPHPHAFQICTHIGMCSDRRQKELAASRRSLRDAVTKNAQDVGIPELGKLHDSSTTCELCEVRATLQSCCGKVSTAIA